MHATHRTDGHLVRDRVRPPDTRRRPHLTGLAAAMPAPAPARGAPERRLYGRHHEREVLDRLLAGVRAGRSEVLVVRGEAGAGKTALLEYLLACASGCQVARAAGVEPETELPFAGLHQLCAPFLDRLGRLPGPQRDALGTAFSLRDGNPPDRFVAGLAVLSLLCAVAGNQPLVCVVDDAQWLDRPSAQALGFAANHLAAAPVAMIFAMRPPAGGPDVTGLGGLSGLAELRVGGLADGDARTLLEATVPGLLGEQIRDRIVAETGGNPGALRELARGLTPAELAAGFGVPGGPCRAKAWTASGSRWRRCRRRPGCCCWSPHGPAGPSVPWPPPAPVTRPAPPPRRCGCGPWPRPDRSANSAAPARSSWAPGWPPTPVKTATPRRCCSERPGGSSRWTRAWPAKPAATRSPRR